MFGYYIDLALRSLRRSPVLTALMVLAIGLGIGASMTMLTVLHVMTADPIPSRSAILFRPQVDPSPMKNFTDGDEPPSAMSWIDVRNLLDAHKGVKQAAMTGGQVTVIPPSGISHAFDVHARFTTADFFALFGVPFVDGRGWSASDGDKRSRVAVITRKLADKLYGRQSAVDKTLRIGKYDFQVVGVIDAWNPEPRFYDLDMGAYADSEQIFMPFRTAMDLKLSVMSNINCWGSFPQGGNMLEANDCAWVKYWVELDTPAQVAAYRHYLVDYSLEQKRLGRFQRPPNTRLRNVMQWLDYNQVVPGSVQLQTLLALGFLLVCLVNTVALLLVKFLRLGGSLSVRRAMGASRRSIFAQLLTEASLIGLAGGAVGLGLALFGLWIVRMQPAQYARLAQLDVSMLVSTFFLAVGVTLLAGLFPAWRACRLAPGRLLKTQ